jgi:Tol biopolymer transport system component
LSSTLQAISLPAADQPPSDTAAGTSLYPSVSVDGRYVAFQSGAANLIPGETGGGGANIYLRDQATGQVTLVSHVPGDPTAAPTMGGDSFRPLISRDGAYVAYTTSAPEIAGQPDGFQGTYSNVMLYDRTTGETTLVSHRPGTTLGADAASVLDAISADGRYIVFHSTATDLVSEQVTTSPGDGYVYAQLFLYDRMGGGQMTGQTYLVSHAAMDKHKTAAGSVAQCGWMRIADGQEVSGCMGASVADDGTVAYVSQATDLVTQGTVPDQANVYRYSLGTQFNELVSTVSGSAMDGAGGAGIRAVISGNGLTVVYTSSAANLVDPNGSNPDGVMNVFRYDQTTGTTTLLSGSRGSATDGGNGNSGAFGFSLAVSHDGKRVAFASLAGDLVPDLVPGQGDAADNVFLYDVSTTPHLTLLSHADGSPLEAAGGVPALDSSGVNYDDRNLLVDPSSNVLSMSDDGARVAYLSDAGNIVHGQASPFPRFNVFLYDLAAGTSLVSGSGGSATTTAADTSGGPVLSADGSALAFPSLAVDLAAGVFDGNGSADVFAYAVGTPGVTLVSRAAFERRMPGNSYSTSVSADGRYTVFTSTATDLVRNQVTANARQNVFVYDKETNTVTLVNHVPGLFSTTGDGGVDAAGRPPADLRPVISADGGFIAFASLDLNLVPDEAFQSGGLVTGYQFIYLFDNRPGPTYRNVTLVSHAPGDPSGLYQDVYAHPVLSDDGRFVAYTSAGYGSPLPHGDIVLYDRVQDTFVDITAPGAVPREMSSDPSLSDNGRFVSYLDHGQVYVYDRDTGNSVLVSHDNSSPTSTTPANGVSSAPVISHDGSAIAFVSSATDLVPNQVASGVTNVFLYKNDTSGADAVGPVSLVSGAGGSASAGGDGNSDSPAIDLDGSFVAYRSDTTDLVSGQVAAGSNVYEFNTQSGTQTLVSHVAGDPAAAAGGSSEPVIDDDGHLVSYVSTAGNLIPGQSGPAGAAAGLKNVFIWLRQTNANILASGRDGSPTVTCDADSDGPLLTRHSFPGFSSKATNLVPGVGGTSVAYINTLVALGLSPNVVFSGSLPGTLVGYLSVTSLLAGQYLPPEYSLPGAEANNALFALGGTTRDDAPLLTQFLANSAGGQVYLIRVHVDVGFGDDVAFLQVAVMPTTGGGGGGGGITVHLVRVRLGRKKKASRLMVQVFDAGGEHDFLSPFQAPRFTNIQVGVVDANGDGVADEVLVTARKGRRHFTATLPA